jgi:hypothetical protein
MVWQGAPTNPIIISRVSFVAGLMEAFILSTQRIWWEECDNTRPDNNKHNFIKIKKCDN